MKAYVKCTFRLSHSKELPPRFAIACCDCPVLVTCAICNDQLLPTFTDFRFEHWILSKMKTAFRHVSRLKHSRVLVSR